MSMPTSLDGRDQDVAPLGRGGVERRTKRNPFCFRGANANCPHRPVAQG